MPQPTRGGESNVALGHLCGRVQQGECARPKLSPKSRTVRDARMVMTHVALPRSRELGYAFSGLSDPPAFDFIA